MKTGLKKLTATIFVLLVSIVFLSANVFAALSPPYVSISGGTFDYNATTNELSITMGIIGTVAWSDGNFAAFNGSEPWHPPTLVDPLIGGTFTISNLFNGDGAGDNWIFDPSPENSPDFTLLDYVGNERLTADIFDFTVVQNGSLFEVNVNFDQDNVGAFNVNANTPDSHFIDDVNAYSLPWGNLFMKFNFTGPEAHDFTETTSGTISGTFAVVPEPLSSILFIAGGAAFTIRRYMKKRIIPGS